MDLFPAAMAAIKARLVATLSVPVYDSVPPRAGQTFVTVGEGFVRSGRANDYQWQELAVEIHSWDSSTRDRSVVYELQSDIRDALHDYALTVPGGDVTWCRCEFGQTWLDEDGLTVHGVQRAEIRVTNN